MLFMTDKSMKEALDDWEKEANKFIEETKKVGATASKKLGEQRNKLREEGDKLFDSFKKKEKSVDIQLEKRYNVTKDKLSRAWEELKK